MEGFSILSAHLQSSPFSGPIRRVLVDRDTHVIVQEEEEKLPKLSDPPHPSPY